MVQVWLSQTTHRRSHSQIVPPCSRSVGGICPLPRCFGCITIVPTHTRTGPLGMSVATGLFAGPAPPQVTRTFEPQVRDVSQLLVVVLCAVEVVPNIQPFAAFCDRDVVMYRIITQRTHSLIVPPCSRSAGGICPLSRCLGCTTIVTHITYGTFTLTYRASLFAVRRWDLPTLTVFGMYHDCTHTHTHERALWECRLLPASSPARYLLR